MTLIPFLKGVIIGFAIAVPVGPVGILCIRKALADGRVAAFIAGLGAAVADTLYGAIAALGLAFVMDFLLENKVVLGICGGVFLIILGLRTITHPPEFAPAGEAKVGLFKDFISTFFITLTNPGTIAGFMVLFASFSVVVDPTEDLLGTGELIAGVFVGSALWWFTLSAAASAVRDRFTPRWILWLNRISGSLIVCFGIGVLLLLGLDDVLDLQTIEFEGLFGFLS